MTGPITDAVAGRLSALSPERRALAERLLADRSRAGDGTAPAPALRPRAPGPPASIGAAPASLGTELLHLDAGSSADEVRESFRRFYDGVSTQLDGSEFGQFSTFLNYGYAPNGEPELARVALPEHCLNRNSVKLVMELVADCDLAGRHVLDVGCGRGGTAAALAEYCRPASVTGLDLAPAAIAFCRSHYRDPRLRFFEGDAEHLPFDDGAFDVVTNVESSHTYPDAAAFYREVYRVLAPGGRFLYTDLLPAQRFAEAIPLLRQIGFALDRDRDITLNVLLSCDQIAVRRVQAYDAANDRALMGDFLSAPGSSVYETMRTRQWLYRILTLRKPGGAATAA